MSEITKYQRSREATLNALMNLWKMSLSTLRNGNDNKIDEINGNMDKLKQTIKHIDNKLYSLRKESSEV